MIDLAYEDAIFLEVFSWRWRAFRLKGLRADGKINISLVRVGRMFYMFTNCYIYLVSDLIF